ncbi:hypothetical protein ACNKHK_20865 [Shigella flexneri]
MRMLSNRAAGLGLSIMAVVVMPVIWTEWEPAERWLALLSCLLKLIRLPYVVLAATYVIGQIMANSLPAHPG